MDDELSIHEQPSELPDGVFVGDGVCFAGEQWDQYEESFERDEDDVQFNDDEEVQSLTESESEALAAVSHANRTMTQARKAVKDARATRRPLPKRSTAASVRESERRCFLCRVPHLARDGPDRNKPTGKGSKRLKDNRKGRKGSGRGKGLGVVTVATAFAVSAQPEVEFVTVAWKRGFSESCDDYNPFDASSPSEQCICSPFKAFVRLEPVATSSCRNPFVCQSCVETFLKSLRKNLSVFRIER